jgi:hypothetical protein
VPTQAGESPPDGPRKAYTRLQAERELVAARRALISRRLGNARLVVFLAGASAAWFVFGPQQWSPSWLLAPALLFLGLVLWHDRVSRARDRALRAAAFYGRGLARLEGRWAGQGQPGNRFLDEAHPYALDLDLFGSGSLYELLCTARTRKGEDTLAAWLLAPAPAPEISARQEAVEELRGRLDLQEAIAVLGDEVPVEVNLEALAAWAGAPSILLSPTARWTALVLATLGTGALIGWGLFRLPFPLLLLVLLVEGGFAFWFSGRVRQVLKPVERRANDLALFGGILARLERERFACAWLADLRGALDATGVPPSRRILQLLRHIDWLNAKRNMLFAPLTPFLLWNTQFAFAVEAWRRRSGPAVAGWLGAVGAFEALSALATFAFENPTHTVPDIANDGPCFEGRAVGHPLIPEIQCVRNDVQLGVQPRVLVVSGSNMSGKSTLLRTLGVSVVLALAGAPVRAERLRLSPLFVGATLRIQDSLQAGRSRFYAEVTRVRQLIELAKGTPPLLFLLDELFQGTNSHDRRIGAEAVLRTLIRYGALGLITTHDLALTQIAQILAPATANVHFQDHLEDGKLAFDYHMRPGVVEHSNALELMRAVGIEV